MHVNSQLRTTCNLLPCTAASSCHMQRLHLTTRNFIFILWTTPSQRRYPLCSGLTPLLMAFNASEITLSTASHRQLTPPPWAPCTTHRAVVGLAPIPPHSGITPLPLGFTLRRACRLHTDSSRDDGFTPLPSASRRILTTVSHRRRHHH